MLQRESPAAQTDRLLSGECSQRERNLRICHKKSHNLSIKFTLIIDWLTFRRELISSTFALRDNTLHLNENLWCETSLGQDEHFVKRKLVCMPRTTHTHHKHVHGDRRACPSPWEIGMPKKNITPAGLIKSFSTLRV